MQDYDKLRNDYLSVAAAKRHEIDKIVYGMLPQFEGLTYTECSSIVAFLQMELLDRFKVCSHTQPQDSRQESIGSNINFIGNIQAIIVN